MEGACGREEKCIQNFDGKPRRKKDLGVHGSIMFGWEPRFSGLLGDE
jgi:hypothetical protein